MPVTAQDIPQPQQSSAAQTAAQQGYQTPTVSPFAQDYVYFGTQTNPAGITGLFTTAPFEPDIAPHFQYGRVTRDDIRSYVDAQGLIFTPGVYNRLVKMAEAGGLGFLNPVSAQSLWNNMIEFSAGAYKAGQKLTPWDVLKMFISANKRGGAGGGGGGGGPFSGTKTMTSSQVDLSDPKTAKALLDATLQSAIGRQSTDKEVRAFVGALNAEERDNPLITTTSTTYQAGVPVSSKSTSKGGFPAPAKQEFSEERAQQHKEYGPFQVATTLMDALLEMLPSG